MAARFLVASVSHCCFLPRPSWRTGMSRWWWSSTDDMVTKWTGRARFELGEGCLVGREEAGTCGTALLVWWQWLLPW